MAGQKRKTSAYDLAVKDGFVGTLPEFLGSLEAGSIIDAKFRAAIDTTQNAVTASSKDNKIPGLAIPILGTGRYVTIVFDSYVGHSVINSYIGGHILESIAGGAADVIVGINSVPVLSTTRPAGLRIECTRLIPAGQTRTYEIGKFVFGAGTGTYAAGAPGVPATLKVIQG